MTALHRNAVQLSLANSVDEVVKFTLDAMESTLGFDHVEYWRVEDEQLKISCSPAHRVAYPVMPLDGPGIVVRAANTKSSVRVADTRKDVSYVDHRGPNWRGPPSMLSELAVPVLIDGVPVAVLNVESGGLASFRSEDQNLLEILAVQVGSELRRLKILDALRGHVAEQERLRKELERYSENLEELVRERTAELADSESRLRLITDSLPALISYVDASLIYRFNNKAYEEWFGRPTSEIIGRHIRDVVGVSAYERTLPRLNAALAGKMQSYDYELTHRSLGTRHVTATYVPDIGEDGMVRGVFVLATDLTDRKRAENALQESEHRYRELFEASPVSLWEEDFSEVKRYFDALRSSGVQDLGRYLVEHPEDMAKCASIVKVVSVNEATLGLYGAKTVEELLGELGRVLIHESQAESRFREELVALWEGKMRFASEFDNQTLTGDIKHVSLVLTVVPGYEKTLERVLVSIVDLTESMEMEQRLQQSERLAAIGQMAAMVGHDLRNPLQGITGATYLLGNETLTHEERNEALRLIESSLQHANELVSELLDYSREVHLTLAEVTPKELTRSALEAVTVPETIQVQDHSQGKPSLLADLEGMRRVFINLITNAIDAMPKGGILTISSKESNGLVELAVSDTGTGVEKRILENLWKPLQTTKMNGIGLGLPIVKRIVDAHGGEISVETKRPGTTFTVRLPVKSNA